MPFSIGCILEASLLLINAVAILNDEFLERIGLSRKSDQNFGFNEEHPNLMKGQLITGIHSIRTSAMLLFALILSLLLLPVISLLLLLCTRKRGDVYDEEQGSMNNDEMAKEDLINRINRSKSRDASNQQRLCVRTSKQLTGHIKAIPALPMEDFLIRVYTMHKDRDKLFREEYEALADLIEDCKIVTASKPENALKNRYKNILPYEHSRIILKRHIQDENPEVWINRSKVEKVEETGFINANYISGYNREHEYIAAQGPLADTVADFWWMIWQEKSTQLIMACSLIEGGRVKCATYWPSDEESYQEYGRIRVKLISKQKTPHYITRTFNISLIPTVTPTGSVSSLTPVNQSDQVSEEMTGVTSDTQRRVTHFQFTGWPDFGAPLSASPLLTLVRKVRLAVNPTDGPILVHCSAGVGRTGTFIMLDIMLQRMAEENRVEVRQTVEALRKERGYMVQSLAQYIFLHDALVEAYLCGITVISAKDLESKCIQYAADNQLLEQLATKLPETQNLYIHPTAGEQANSVKNRDCTVIPYQRTCVPLLQYKPEKGYFDVSVKDSYINASFVQGYWLENNFIVTQEPLSTTMFDFWSLLLQQNCPCIINIQITRFQEDLIPNGSAFSIDSGDSISDQTYLPNDIGTELEFNFIKIECIDCIINDDKCLEERKLILRWGKGKEYKVTHYTFHFNKSLLSNYSQMSDSVKKNPKGLKELISFINHTRSIYKSQQMTITAHRSRHPILLYDKLGTNFCGIFTAISIGMDNLDNEDSFDLLQCCRTLCSERPKIITSIGDIYLILRGLVLYNKEFRQNSH
ncbi:hypothetical protein LOD99_6524 [Oopsacas minuta]|uniref:Uncharacterized protein n=1 Tax=Oopsacas minuta TaxID=111878 RepID=A0AAV7JMS3_9METZ|nr:hypothetical protein LOD99_6524 [Oopsacas minuta]